MKSSSKRSSARWTTNPDRTFYNLNIDAGAMWARRVIDSMVARETSPQHVQAAE